MMRNFNAKKQAGKYYSLRTRVLSVTLLICLSVECVYPSVTGIQMGSGAEQPIADAATGFVDLYTGDFKYDLPILSVPGPNGENVDINLNYRGGIKTDQKASWIGLGWDFNPGEISRQIIGAPDDYSGQPIIRDDWDFSLSNRGTYYSYGPFNYNKMSGTSNSFLRYPLPTGFSGLPAKSSADAYLTDADYVSGDYRATSLGYSSSYGDGSQIIPAYYIYPTAKFRMPGYDKYFVSGQGISGELQPFMLTNAKLGAQGGYPTANSSVKTQFYFENSAKGMQSNPENHIKSGYYIKYYTNNEINNNSKLYSNSTQIGFLDFQTITSGLRRPATEFDTDGIGGIQVTTPEGLTYHYSLPVYTHKQFAKTFYSVNTQISLTNTSFQKHEYTFMPYKFATSWKLTAITGTDYIDINNNKVVDIGDQGYWIAYNYKLWSNEFNSDASFNNYRNDFSPLGNGIFFVTNSGSSYPNPTYQKSYNNCNMLSQLYYLDNIRTQSHTAYFVKTLRLDEHSLINQGKAVPQLKLSRIILLNNEDKSVMENPSQSLVVSGSLASKIDLTKTRYSSNDFFHESKYLANKNAIDDKSLKSIEFKQDYSLCKKVYNNLNNTCTTVDKLFSPNHSQYGRYLLANGSNVIFSFYKRATNNSNFTTIDQNNSGKLTLNEVVSYESKGEKVFPSHIFDYEKNNSQKNPDYDSWKADCWGFYKSDRTSIGGSEYPTPTSAQQMDAWSLRSILLPTGSKIEIEYEPDEISNTGFRNDSLRAREGTLNQRYAMCNYRPKLLYPVFSANFNNGYPVSPYLYLITDYRFEYDDFSDLTASYAAAGLLPTNYQYYYSLGSINHCNVPIGGAGSFNYQNTFMVKYSGFGTSYSVVNTNAPTPTFNFLSHQFDSNQEHNNYEVVPQMKRICSSGNQPLMGDGYLSYSKAQGYGFVMVKLDKMFGGGIRVKKIRIKDPTSTEQFEKKFEYEGGYCAVMPNKFEIGPTTSYLHNTMIYNLKYLNPYGSGSSVGYTKVTTKNINSFNESNGKVEYVFHNGPIDNPLLGKFYNKTSQNIGNCAPNTQCCFSEPQKLITNNIHATLDNRELKLLGSLLSVEMMNNQNQRVGKTTYEYDAGFCISENFWAVDQYDPLNSERHIPWSSMCKPASQCSQLPSCAQCNVWSTVPCQNKERYNYFSWFKDYQIFLKKVTSEIDGISNIISYERAFNSEAGPNPVIETSSNENVVKTTKTWAYNIYPELGFKWSNESNKNMVLAVSSCTVQKESNEGSLKYIIQQTKQDYSKSFTYRVFNDLYNEYINTQATRTYYYPSVSYKRLLDDNINANSPGTPQFRAERTSSLFNIRNKPIETVGLNGRKSSIKYGYNNMLALTSANDCSYGSYTFSSFEDVETVSGGGLHYGGEIRDGQYRVGTISSIIPHTGKYMHKVANATSTLYFTKDFDRDRNYVVKLWVHKASPNNSGLSLTFSGFQNSNNQVIPTWYLSKTKSNSENITVGDWTLINLGFSLPANLNPANGAISIAYSSTGGTSYIDDLMFNPTDTPIKGTVYEFTTGRVVASLDNENFATFNNYDDAGRIVSQFKETKNHGVVKVIENKYNNSRQ